MLRDLRAYVWDAAEAVRLLASFTQGKTFQDHLGDPPLRSAVERQFEIVGEALRQASARFPETLDRITNCREIVGFRERLIHGYSAASHEVVWGIIESDLPRLRAEIEQWLADLG
jgi:uncharacterized protein with HEPN domain